MDPLSSAAISWIVGQTLTKAADALRGSDVERDLDRELNEWQEQVSGSCKATLTNIFSITSVTEADSPHLLRLREQLAENQIPAVETFTRALVESWERVHRQSEVQPFFAAELPQVKPQLQNLAKRFARVCQTNQKLLFPKLYEVMQRLDENRREDRQAQRKLMQMVQDLWAAQKRKQIEDSDSNLQYPASFLWQPTWEPREAVEGANACIEEEASLDELAPKIPILVTFADKLSTSWQDPKLASIAIWDSKAAISRPVYPTLPRALHGKGRDMAQQNDAWSRCSLCIPSYSLPVEWRVESYVYWPPWKEAKRRVVQSFLEKCRGRQVRGLVISVRRDSNGPVVLVHSTDYDDFLRRSWSYYKGLEAALTMGEYYKWKTSRRSESALELLAGNLAKSGEILKLIPRHYQDLFGGRKIQKQDIHFMLTGIMQREQESIKRHERPAAGHRGADRSGPASAARAPIRPARPEVPGART